MYLKYYGLRENPFNVTSDPHFLYLSKAHKDALAHLVYGINERKGFLEITGEVGAGKTTLCKALLKRLDGNTKTAFILDSNLSELQLLEAILADFGLQSKRRSKIALLRQLNEFLLGELRQNSNVVLILDEAQNLTLSTLEGIRLLSNLETDKQKLFQIVLVGQPQLRQKLNSPSLLQLRQRIGVRFHIGPLGEDEMEQYIYHRIGVASFEKKNNICFAQAALEKIFKYSGGIPRLINLVCDKALLTGFVLEARLIDGNVIDKSIHEIEGKAVEVGV